MLFAIGTRVRLRFTGERGVITARLSEDMLQVRLDNDPNLEIPAFEEDLTRDTDAEPVSAGAKFVPGKMPKKPEAPPRRVLQAQYLILKPKGIQLAFEPMPGRDGSVSKFKCWLVNDTGADYIFELDLFTASRNIAVVDDKINATSAVELGDMIYDDLNDQLEAWIRVSKLTTQGPEDPLERSLKIKAKSFFNNAITAPVLNVITHTFVLIDATDKPETGTADAGQSLKDYTKENIRRSRKNTPSSTPLSPFNVEEFAKFIPEIDLHIENLLNGHAKLDKSEILRIQLQHFQRFMEKAVRLGVPNVFIIHGVGEGKLREAIAERLRQNPHVVKFKNEYHHKYGYGATEVIL